MTPRVPGYELLEPICLREGWGSDVYKARHAGLGCLVAIRIFGPFAAASAHLRENFWAGCGVLEGLTHPNIERVLDYGEGEDGRH